MSGTTNKQDASSAETRVTEKLILVTGSSGLIGSEVCSYFAEQGFAVHGVANNQRAVFFGPRVIPAGISTASSGNCRHSCTTSSTSATDGACWIC